VKQRVPIIQDFIERVLFPKIGANNAHVLPFEFTNPSDFKTTLGWTNDCDNPHVIAQQLANQLTADKTRSPGYNCPHSGRLRYTPAGARHKSEMPRNTSLVIRGLDAVRLSEPFLHWTQSAPLTPAGIDASMADRLEL
jgi:hypothetical protein